MSARHRCRHKPNRKMHNAAILVVVAEGRSCGAAACACEVIYITQHVR